MLLRTERKGIAIQSLLFTRASVNGLIETRVVLVRLDTAEVVRLTLIVRAILTVDLERLLVDRRNILRKRLQDSSIQRLGIIAVGLRGRLNNPDEFLDRVIERQIDAVVRRRDSLILVELGLFNEILVGVLGHTTALLRIKIDLIDVESRRRRRLGLGGNRRNLIEICSNELGVIPENVDLHLMVLERDEREGTTRVACKEKEERDVDSRRKTRATRGIFSNATIGCRNCLRSIVLAQANHTVQLQRLGIVRRKRVPQVEKLTLLAIDDLSTDIELRLLNQVVTQASFRIVVLASRRKLNLNLRRIEEIRMTTHDRCLLRAPVRLAREVDTERLHRKVRVALEETLPESDLRIST